jgi:hypothetical protein
MTRTDRLGMHRWRRDPIGIVSFFLIWGGILADIGGYDGMIALTGIGLFGPLLLRELGLLPWIDEFHREATTRASQHAYLSGGICLVIVMTVFGFGGTHNEEGAHFFDAVPASLVLLIMALTWYLSRLLQFWGALVGASRILLGALCAYGLVAAVATIQVIINLGAGESPRRVMAWLATIYLPPAFLALATWCSRRWPRITGVTLLALSAWLFFGFRLTSQLLFGAEFSFPWQTRVVLACLLLAPLVASGIALVAGRRYQD